MNRSISRVFWVLAGGFVLLAFALGYWQVVHASAINDHPGNPQTIQRSLLIARGPILAADGAPLAVSVGNNVNGQVVYHRVYPNGTLAPQTVGYSNVRLGSTALELSQNNWLTGDYGAESLLVRLGLRSKRGEAVHTTLIPTAQRVANQMLAGQQGAVVALDPRTGAVEVMASSPGFDLARVDQHFASIASQKGSPLVNRTVQEGFPPGSTFKVVTATAALQTGLFTPNSMFNDTGSIIASGQPLRELRR